MSDFNEERDQVQEVASDSPGDATEPEAEPTADDTDEHQDRPAREAAKYRRQLREVEAERNDLAGHLETARRQLVEAAVVREGSLADPNDLWLGGVTVADLVDEQGAVDAVKVAEAVSGVLAAHPSWRRATVPGVPAGVRHHPEPTGRGWAQALKK